MTSDNIARFESELKDAYGGATVTTDGGRRLVRLPALQLPDGCKPSSTVGLVVLDPTAAKPDLVLKEVPTMKSGSRPAVGTIGIAGESWQSYSFNLQWEEEKHTAIQFVEGKLRRLGRES